jgi:hypothetical protein
MPRAKCLTSARFNMRADILKAAGSPSMATDNTNTEDAGTWQYRQNEDSGAIETFWQPDDPTTQDVDETFGGKTIEGVHLIARGIMDGGIRVAGTTERFSEIYENVDWVKATFPSGTSITKKDRVTNISSRGKLVWTNEEADGNPATVFEVMGVTPVIDPFGQVLELSVLLQRSEVQDANR